jgi:hypothetical protein
MKCSLMRVHASLGEQNNGHDDSQSAQTPDFTSGPAPLGVSSRSLPNNEDKNKKLKTAALIQYLIVFPPLEDGKYR